MKFLKVDTLYDARKKLLDICEKPKIENIELTKSLGRILAIDIISDENVPYFRRSTVDGYAVISKDTELANCDNPVFLNNNGYIHIGTLTEETIKNSMCMEVPTGGMVPNGADAVIMLEYTKVIDNSIAIIERVNFGENIINIGDDIEKGVKVISKGKKIMPQDIGAMAALGITKVQVYKPLSITIISTGDEIVNPKEKADNGKIRDINTYTVQAFAVQNGYSIIDTCVISDDIEAIEAKIKKSLKNSDIVLLSGGSSKGTKDSSRDIINRITTLGIFTEGLAIKPGKPTILGYNKDSKTIVGCLPGHPISAIVIFNLLFGWLNQQLTGGFLSPVIYAELTTDVQAQQGKLTFYPVKLQLVEGGYKANPIFKKSGLITAMTQADGYFLIEQGEEGIEKGKIIAITLL